MLLLFLLFLLDEGEITSISHFNDMDFCVFFYIFRLLINLAYLFVFSRGTVSSPSMIRMSGRSFLHVSLSTFSLLLLQAGPNILGWLAKSLGLDTDRPNFVGL